MFCKQKKSKINLLDDKSSARQAVGGVLMSYGDHETGDYHFISIFTTFQKGFSTVKASDATSPRTKSKSKKIAKHEKNGLIADKMKEIAVLNEK